MTFYTIDTSTIISRKLLALPDNFLFSSVVLLELLASANDDSERRLYENVYKAYSRDNSLIVPNGGDWLMASKVLFWLAQGRKRGAKGKFPKLVPGAAQKMALDALIATSARRWKATIVTENWDDFKAIQKYCDVKIVKASEFFTD